ncbi:MAG: response regulator [Elusimicrobiota bacterium]
MTEPSRTTILIVDDDPELASLVEFTLQRHDYQSIWAENGVKGIEKIFSNPPNLVLLDLDMPGMSGFEFCKQVRKDFRVRHIPIMMMTGTRKDLEYKIKGLELGSDDYIIKPFEPEELVARVKAILQRCARDLDASPLTHLPGNSTIIREIDSRLSRNKLFAAIYIDLNNFKAFNDKYGFVRGDEVIKFVSQILLDLISENLDENDFIAHIGGDDFVMLTLPEKAQEFAEEIIKKFDSGIVNFYDIGDRDAGYIITTDRRGNEKKFPLMSISLAIVHNTHRTFFHAGQISVIASELKTYAKTFGASKYVIDRRKF